MEARDLFMFFAPMFAFFATWASFRLGKKPSETVRKQGGGGGMRLNEALKMLEISTAQSAQLLAENERLRTRNAELERRSDETR